MKAKKKILLIDDDCECIEYIGSILAKAGFQVVSAMNGEEGLQRAASEHPDLILLDVMMPEMDGWDTCDGVRAAGEIDNVPVVFLTCVKPPKNVSQPHGALETSWDEYLTKPVRRKELLATVGRLV